MFSTDNMRNTALKEVRQEWKDSRFFFGSNKIMKIALGKAPEDEIKKDIHNVSNHLQLQCGLLFTNRSTEETKEFFGKYTKPDFARSGSVAVKSITLPEGPLTRHELSTEDVSFPSSALDMLVRLGLKQAELKKGVIALRAQHKVCEIGDTLTPEQCRILKLWHIQLADFRFLLQCVYDIEKEKYTNFLSTETL